MRKSREEKRQKQDEESLGLTPVLLMPPREQGLSLCPLCLFNADRGRGVLCCRGNVTECAH